MDFPSPDGRSKTADVRKVALLFLEKTQDGKRTASAIEISKALGYEFVGIDPTRRNLYAERVWSRYCVALWEAVPGYLENLLADPKPEPEKPPGRPLWERLDDD